MQQEVTWRRFNPASNMHVLLLTRAWQLPQTSPSVLLYRELLQQLLPPLLPNFPTPLSQQLLLGGVPMCDKGSMVRLLEMYSMWEIWIPPRALSLKVLPIFLLLFMLKLALDLPAPPN